MHVVCTLKLIGFCSMYLQADDWGMYPEDDGCSFYVPASQWLFVICTLKLIVACGMYPQADGCSCYVPLSGWFVCGMYP